MKILFIGDVVGENGQDLLVKAMPKLKAEHKPDITIVNGENSHKSGTGLTETDARFLFGCGADVITGGNHSLRRCNVDFYEENEFVLCPANFNVVNDEKCGVCVVDMGRYQLCVVSLIGTVFLDANRSPFFEMDKIIKKYGDMPIFVDFHAEATSEKYALAHYLDGKVSAVVGTHTHVQTNDDHILPNGTAYISDAGCVCALDSVLGMDKKACVTKQKYLCPVKFEVAKGEGFVNGVVIDIDIKTRKAVSIDKIHTKFN